MTQREIDLRIAEVNLGRARRWLTRWTEDPWVGYLHLAHGELRSSAQATIRANKKG